MGTVSLRGTAVRRSWDCIRTLREVETPSMLLTWPRSLLKHYAAQIGPEKAANGRFLTLLLVL